MTKACPILWLALALATPPEAPWRVDRVGPPSWWSGPVARPLMLLVEGSGLEGSTVRVKRGPLTISGSEAGPGGHALFVETVVPGGAAPGPCEIEVASGARSATVRWDLHPPPSRSADPIGPDDVIYLVMPDRFADGDPGNNDPPGGGRMLDRADLHAYHGGDFAGLLARLPYLVDLGVTAIWLTPIYRSSDAWYDLPSSQPPRRFADFHGYSAVEFYETNPRFGTPSQYQALVDQAHRLGLKVIQDHVLGHTGPAHRWVARPPGPGWYHGPVERPPSCTFRFDLAADPHATEADRRGLTDGWFAGILPDLNVRDPRVARYAIQQSSWWATRFEADGIRLDTYPMVDRAFWRDWSRGLAEVRPGLRAIGEAWVVDPALMSFFQGGRPGWDGVDPGVEMLFDFPVWAASVRAFTGRAPASSLARALGRDHLYPRADRLVTFLDNHDTPRIASEPGATPARLRLAVAFLLTSRGTPQITWGDEIGMGGHMDDRRDFPGGFPGDPRDATRPEGRTPEEAVLFETYRDLLRLRKASSPLRRGSLTHLAATDSVYAYLREHEGSRMVVALNLGATPTTVELPSLPPGPAESAHGPGRWSPGPPHPRVELPAESAAVFRLGPHEANRVP